MLLLFLTGATAPTAVVATGGSDGKRRRRDADEELSVAEFQAMQRKLAQLKKAKKEKLAKELELAPPDSSQDDVAEVTKSEIEKFSPQIFPIDPELMLNTKLMSSITDKITHIVKLRSEIDARRRFANDEDEVTMFSLIL